MLPGAIASQFHGQVRYIAEQSIETAFGTVEDRGLAEEPSLPSHSPPWPRG
jgi:hypothetical protein